jgi:hypothetical protein
VKSVLNLRNGVSAEIPLLNLRRLEMYQHFLPQIPTTFDELQTIILEEIATI